VFKVNNHLPSGMILIDDLTNFTQGIQKIYRKAINSDIPNSKKRIKKYIRDSTGLVISDVRAGSFEIELKQHRSQVIDNNANIDFENITGSIYTQSLNTITDIMSSLNSKEVGNIIIKYDLETFKATKEWIKNLKNSNNSFKYNGNKKEFIFDNNKILETNQLLESLDEDFEKSIKISGVLTGVNHQNSTISINDISSEENYLIKVHDKKFKKSNYTTNLKVSVKVKLHQIMVNSEVISKEMYIDSISNINVIK
ncbi:hypothetical protein, partial [Mammaliicoccus sciuri]